jgi:hypothetical protein
MLSKAKVFKDDKGNRMMFPGYIYDEGEELPSQGSFWNTGIEIKIATGLDMEPEWFDFDRAKFPHVKTSIGSSGFAHGSAEVYLFDGPAFLEIKEQGATDEPDIPHG